MRAVSLSTAACLAVVVIAGCGGSSKSSSSTSTAPSTAAHTTSHGGKSAPSAFQQLQPGVKGSKPSGSVTVNAGVPVAIITHVPPTAAGKRLTVAIDQTNPTTFAATSSVAGAPLHHTGTIHVNSSGVQISAVRWSCRYPPPSFCPVHVQSSSTSHVKLTVDKPTGAVVFSTLFNKPGAVPTPSLIPLGLPAPGSSVQATTQVVAQPLKKGAKSAPPATSATAAPGSLLHVLVRVASGSPAHGNLIIAIPKTAGDSITIGAGGTQGKPSSTATVKSSGGNLRVLGATWGCTLPPATFCPFSSVKTTATGLTVQMPTPQVPVQLTFITAKG